MKSGRPGIGFALALVAALGAVVGACRKPPPPAHGEAHVISFSPATGEVEPGDLANGIRVTFDRVAAPPDAIGKVIAGPAFTITPSVAGEARWLDERTLAYFPGPARGDAGAGLTPGHAYSIALAGNVQLAAGIQPARWEGARIVYQRIRVEYMRLRGPRDFQPTSPVVDVVASQVPGPASARGCAFVEKRAGGELGKSTPAVVAEAEDAAARSGELDDEGAAARARRLRVRPAAPLERGTPYVLRCAEDFRPASGGEGLREPSEEAFTTYGDAGIKSLTPARDSEVPADGVELVVAFATPMPADDVRRHVRLTTAAGAAVPATFVADYTGTTFRYQGDLPPRTSFRVVVEPGLVDNFGQALPGGRTHDFRVGDAGPRLEVPVGAFVLERSAGAHAGGRLPIAARNLPQLTLTCADVPEERLPDVLALPDDYQAFDREESGENRHPVAWTKLGLEARKTVVKPEGARNAWKREGLDLAASCAGKAGGRTGVYVVELATTGERVAGKAQPHWRRAVASVTDLGILAKVGNASSLFWVVRLATGAPVAGAAIKVRDARGQVRFSGTSGADGVLLGPAAATLQGESAREKARDEEDEESDYGWRARRVVVTAAAGDDMAVLDTTWTRGLEAWSFETELDRTPSATRIRGFIHSDRGLYRPGDTVHLRGLLRAVNEGGRMTVPKQRKVRLVIEDPRGTEIVAADVPVSVFGSFNRDVALPAEARLGDWRVKAQGPGFVVRDHFAVEEYRPRSFEVAVKAAPGTLFLGRRLDLDVSANYLHGAPVRAGKVTWTLRRRPHAPAFEDFPGFVFQDLVTRFDAGDYWARDEERSFSEGVADGEVALDAAGKAHVAVPTREVERAASTAQDLLFEAQVADPSGQVVGGSAVVTGHRANLYLGFQPSEMVQTAGRPFAVKVVGFDAAGKRRAATARLSLTRRSYECGQGKGSDPDGWGCKRKDDARPAVSQDVQVPAAGDAAAVEVVVPAPGLYVVRVEGPDGRGANAVSTDELWVAGAGEAGDLFDVSRDEQRLPLVLSKARYRPGDVARVMPQAPLAGAHLLVTLERDGVLHHRVLSGLANGSALEVPVEESLVPNAFVAVAVVRGTAEPGGAKVPRFQAGLVPLAVESAARRLTVVVEPERASYEPGQKVTARLKVLSAEGKSVKAELAVAAADEGVLQILGFRTPDPLPAFYAPFKLGVESATTLNMLARLDEEALAKGKGGDSGGNEAGRVRSRFMATAFWQPALVTRADGTAEVSFVAPDNLTAFRVMAVAADVGDRFGAGEARFAVKKSLQLLPALPRFLTVGDQVQAATLVQNNTRDPLRVTVGLEATGVEAASAAPQEFEVPAGASRRVEVAVTARAEGSARFRFRATGGGLSDAVDTTIPVQRALVPETLVLGEGSSTTPVTLAIPPSARGAEPGGSLEVVLDRTGLSQLDEGLAYLVEYPYGCLEQLTSRVVPMVALRELAAAGAGVGGVAADKLDRYVRAGVAKMLLHQGDDGGFGLWLGARPELHYTAYALWGLGVVSRAGVPVPAAALRNGASYLRANLQGGEPNPGASAAELAGQAATRAFAAMVLAELEPDEVEPGTLMPLFAQRQQLPIYGRAFLLSALAKIGHGKMGHVAEVATLVRELGALAPPGDGPVVLHESIPELGWYWNSDVRTTALVLQALLETAPRDPLIERLSSGLLGARIAGRWETTQENAYGLLALAAQARARAAAGQSRVVVTVAGRAQPPRILRGGAIERLSFSAVDAAAPPLVLDISGGRVSYSARLHLRRPLGSDASDRGLRLRREYLDADTGAPLTRFRLGQAVRVRLTITAAGRQAHVALVDRLPAGFEPILTRFTPSALGGDDDRPVWWRSFETDWQHQELRDDRMLVFADTLAAGPSQREYLVRATAVGSFAAPPTTAEAMYAPAINGRAAAAKVVVEK
jgi:uncharacterized protein YfaS (alpha-2-macroglobulin family)